MGKRIATAALLGGIAVGVAAQTAPRGYLQPGALDIVQVLTPAPVRGDARDKADRAIFRATRHWVGTPRYVMATNDVKLDPASMLADFSCGLGVDLTPASAPLTVALVSRVAFEAGRASGTAKDFYHRDRPYLIDRGAYCQPASELKGSYDYPSGHAALGWTWAMLLVRLAPDRTTPILARGRAFGESRIVCGVHNASAVEAGRVVAAAAVTAVESRPAFEADLRAARSELDALRRDPASARPGARCGAEAALVGLRVY